MKIFLRKSLKLKHISTVIFVDLCLICTLVHTSVRFLMLLLLSLLSLLSAGYITLAQVTPGTTLLSF